jgi:hypothetical protein
MTMLHLQPEFSFKPIGLHFDEHASADFSYFTRDPTVCNDVRTLDNCELSFSVKICVAGLPDEYGQRSDRAFTREYLAGSVAELNPEYSSLLSFDLGLGRWGTSNVRAHHQD